MSNLSQADLEQLSAYLDNELPPPQRAALERRLAADADLRAELEALREVVMLVRSVPALRAPRDFRLDPAIYGRSVRRPTRARRVYRWSSALSAVAAAITLVVGIFGILRNSQSSLGDHLLEQTAPQAVGVALTADGFFAERGTPVAAIATPTPLPTQRPLPTQEPLSAQTAIPQTETGYIMPTGDVQEMAPQAAAADEVQEADSGTRDVQTPLPGAVAVEAASAAEEEPSDGEAAANAAEGMLADQDTPLPAVPTLTAPEPGGAPPDAFVAPPAQPDTGASPPMPGVGSGGAPKPPTPGPATAYGLGGGTEPTPAGIVPPPAGIVPPPAPTMLAAAPTGTFTPLPTGTPPPTATAVPATLAALADSAADAAADAADEVLAAGRESATAQDVDRQHMAATATALAEVLAEPPAAEEQRREAPLPFALDPGLLVGASLVLLALAAMLYALSRRAV